MHPEISQSVNGFFDLLGIIKSFLLHSSLFDLLQDPYLLNNLRVHAVEIGRLSDLRLLSRSLTLLTATLIRHGCSWRGRFFLKVVRADAVECDEAYLVENVKVVQMTLMEDKLKQ